MDINLSELNAANIYHLVTQTLVPRPIAWVLTESSKENYNLAPFSYFSAVSSEPALLMLSIGQKPNGDEKDTFVNLLNNKKAVIHISSDHQYQEVTKTAASLSHGESELLANEIETTDFDGFELPRLNNSHIAFGCSLYQTEKIANTNQNLVLVKIEQLYISDSVVSEDEKGRLKVDANKIKPLARLGANEYASFGKIISMARPK